MPREPARLSETHNFNMRSGMVGRSLTFLTPAASRKVLSKYPPFTGFSSVFSLAQPSTALTVAFMSSWFEKIHMLESAGTWSTAVSSYPANVAARLKSVVFTTLAFEFSGKRSLKSSMTLMPMPLPSME